MGRTISGTLNSILLEPERDINWTLDVMMWGGDIFRFATAAVTVGGFPYTNELESVSEIRQTLEQPIDRVAVGIQNKDRVLGRHVISNPQEWQPATAILGRRYFHKTLGVVWLEMFRGGVQRPVIDDLRVSFILIADTTSAGEIVCVRNLSPSCGFRFRDPKTCAYPGDFLQCNHLLKSSGGCEGRNNTHHFGGTEHRYEPDQTIPGTGGNVDDPPPGDGSIDCPRVDQYVLVRGTDGKPTSDLTGRITTRDSLWNPIRRKFVPVRTAYPVRGCPIFKAVAASGAVGFSSGTHPLIADEADERGRKIREFKASDSLLSCYEDRLIPSRAVLIESTPETGDVVRIELDTPDESEKIYCYGDKPDGPFIVCHNSKLPLT